MSPVATHAHTSGQTPEQRRDVYPLRFHAGNDRDHRSSKRNIIDCRRQECGYPHEEQGRSEQVRLNEWDDELSEKFKKLAVLNAADDDEQRDKKHQKRQFRMGKGLFHVQVFPDKR